MVLNETQVKEFKELSKQMMRFLCDNFNPHTTVIITGTDAEILSGSASVVTDEFVRD